jgi:copper resistance protein D
MSVDALSALIRALSFIALFQAAGVAITIATFGRLLDRSAVPIRRVGFYSALAGLPLVAGQYALEAARMAGELAGAFDPFLQQLVLQSPLSVAAGFRLAGLVLVTFSMKRSGAAGVLMGSAGALCIVLGFTFVGHTADDARSDWLTWLLVLHLVVVAFWFGGLAPLHIAAATESRERAAEIVAAFSRIATVIVPGLFVAGVLMTVLLVDRWEVFGESYGLVILGKALGFAALMVLAALNRSRYGPAIAAAEGAIVPFQRTVVIELVLITAVLAATAVMTSFFSPSH